MISTDDINIRSIPRCPRMSSSCVTLFFCSGTYIPIEAGIEIEIEREIGIEIEIEREIGIGIEVAIVIVLEEE